MHMSSKTKIKTISVHRLVVFIWITKTRRKKVKNESPVLWLYRGVVILKLKKQKSTDDGLRMGLQRLVLVLDQHPYQY
jgi:hypothetical protein